MPTGQTACFCCRSSELGRLPDARLGMTAWSSAAVMRQAADRHTTATPVTPTKLDCSRGRPSTSLWCNAWTPTSLTRHWYSTSPHFNFTSHRSRSSLHLPIPISGIVTCHDLTSLTIPRPLSRDRTLRDQHSAVPASQSQVMAAGPLESKARAPRPK